MKFKTKIIWLVVVTLVLVIGGSATAKMIARDVEPVGLESLQKDDLLVETPVGSTLLNSTPSTLRCEGKSYFKSISVENTYQVIAQSDSVVSFYRELGKKENWKEVSTQSVGESLKLHRSKGHADQTFSLIFSNEIPQTFKSTIKWDVPNVC